MWVLEPMLHVVGAYGRELFRDGGVVVLRVGFGYHMNGWYAAATFLLEAVSAAFVDVNDLLHVSRELK